MIYHGCAWYSILIIRAKLPNTPQGTMNREPRIVFSALVMNVSIHAKCPQGQVLRIEMGRSKNPMDKDTWVGLP